ncbi:hypothetical protein WJX74_004521 [Apatococcus lobatus]|uniref:Magnesium transporter n=1 Tax=Apatococcus lobatus TaxID=904363 RepID=A0AAW1QVU4_9CHLO
MSQAEESPVRRAKQAAAVITIMKATRFGALSANGREGSAEQESSRGLLAGHSPQYADSSKQAVVESMHNTPSRRINAQRKWLRLDSKGKASYITADKHTMVSQLGIPYRDLRVLDSAVSQVQQTSLFIREKALVVNVESIKMLVCKDQVFVLSVPTPGDFQHGMFPSLDSRFVHFLADHLCTDADGSRETHGSHVDLALPYELRALEAALISGTRIMETDTTELENQALPSLKRLIERVSRKELDIVGQTKSSLNRLSTRVGRLKQVLETILDDDHDMHDMYLARREMLAKEEAEADAEVASMRSSARGSDIGQGPHPSSDPHRIRSDDMLGSSPTHHASFAPDTNFSSSEEAAASLEEADEEGISTAPGRSRTSDGASGQQGFAADLRVKRAQTMSRPRLAYITHISRGDSMASSAAEIRRMRSTLSPAHRTMTRVSSRQGEGFGEEGILEEPVQTMSWTKAIALVDPRDIESCEELLEAYFMQVDSLSSRLAMLKEKIEATESLIALDLDQRRNELTAFDLVLTIVTLSVAFVSMIASIFGQNLYWSTTQSPLSTFLLVTLLSVFVALAGLLGIIMYARTKRLLLIGSPAPLVAQPVATAPTVSTPLLAISQMT